jgi:hypothetical protein
VPGSLVGLIAASEEPSMLAGAHQVLRIVTGRRRTSQQVGPLDGLPGMRRRRAWARSVHGLLEADSRCWRRPHPYWDFPPLVRREVVWACRPALLAVAEVLGDERQPVSAVALRQLKQFLIDPSTSPLFGDDAATARLAAQQLQRCFTGHPEPYVPR